MSLLTVFLIVLLSGTLCWLHGRHGQGFKITSVFSRLFQSGHVRSETFRFGTSVYAKQSRRMSDAERLSLYQNIFDTLDTAVIVRDVASGEVIFFNDVWRKFTGKEEEELYTQKAPGHLNFILPDGVTPVLPEETPMYQALQGHSTSNRFLNIGTDEQKTLLISGYPLRDSSGVRTGAMAVVQDFSEVRDIELELERERLLLRAIIKVLPDAFVFRDMTGKAILVNDVMYKFRPQARENVFRERVVSRDFLSGKTGKPIPAGQTPIERALTGEPVFREELIQIRSGNPNLDLIATSIPVYDHNQQQYGAFTIFQDVTALKKAAELRDKTKRAQALHNLAAGLAHDFNNQLGTVLGNAQLALAELEDQPLIRDNLNAIVDVVHTSANLTRRLMTLGNTSGGEPQRLNLRTIFQDFMPAIQAVFEAYAELIVRDIDPDLYIFSDKTQFESALLNLLLNAKDATESTSNPQVAVDIKVLATTAAQNHGLDPEHRYVCVAVEDNGEGFTSRSREDAFDPFFSTRNLADGTGLGLTMVDGFVRQYEGQVHISDDQSELTRVEIILPLDSGPASTVTDESVESQVLTGSGQRVLVIEDRPALLAVSCNMLRLLNYSFVGATSAEDGLRRLEEDPSIELIIVDIMLGDGMNGVEMMEVVESRRPDVKAIYTSGYAGNRRNIRLPKERPFLQKPAELVTLSQLIHRVLASPDRVDADKDLLTMH